MPSPIPTTEGTSYTWSDYLSWPEDERWEIIGGKAFPLTPSPSTLHQIVLGNLAFELFEHLRGRPCRPFIGPIAVKLSELDVVEPDILVVCDSSKIRATHIEGAPDMVVEVLSPATSAKDLREKKALYERSGVREYLVVDPLEYYAIRFLNGADGFDKGTVFAADERLVLESIENLEVPLWEVFELPSPETRSGPEDTSV